jgi:hypothetical protein
MSGFDQPQRAALRPVIDVARGVLRRFDDEEVPPKLRRVAAYSGGSLPAPLASALLVELDRNDWFREKVGEAWHDEGQKDTIGAAFLDRPPGWWLDVAEAATGTGSSEAATRLREAEQRIGDLEARLRAARDKAKALAERASSAEAELRERDAADTAPLRNALEATKRRLADAERNIARTEERIAGLEADLATAANQLVAAGEEQRHLREERADLLHRLDAGDDESRAMTPRAVAGELDRLFVTLRPFRELTLGTPPAGEEWERPVLPAGVAPDSAAAIEALRTIPGPFTVLIDGHNMLGVTDAAKLADAAARRDLVNRLGRLRAALAGRDVVVVFDSSLDEGRGGYRSDGGVEVAFAVGATTADDEIVRLSGIVPGPVVVSDDREVRERAFRVRALTLWSRALIDWLG